MGVALQVKGDSTQQRAEVRAAITIGYMGCELLVL